MERKKKTIQLVWKKVRQNNLRRFRILRPLRVGILSNLGKKKENSLSYFHFMLGIITKIQSFLSLMEPEIKKKN
jgi:hypothetical protein